jgi:N-acyl homoserine lactone hydrolase
MRLYILTMGMSEASGVPFPAYLIRTDDGTNVLVDTGFARTMVGLYRDPNPAEAVAASGASEATVEAVRSGRFPVPRVDEENYVVNALAALGVQPQDIAYLVATHFDFDHVGALDAFPEAEVVVQQRQIEAARAGNPRFAPTRSQWDRPGIRLQTLDGDTQLHPGIELIASPGHVPGHQSVLVRLPETGPILLAIDAMSRALGEYTPETRPTSAADANEHDTRASTRKLLDLAQREAALIIYGHDPEQWRTLKHAPDYYA